MNTTVNKFTTQNFSEQVLNNSQPVLVDFWAEWCGPCRAQNPILEDLAQELDGKISIGKVNVDDNQELAQQYNIMSIPSLLVFKDGEIIQSFVGVQYKDQILTFFQNSNLI